MRFAKRSFTLAGSLGLLMILPMFFLYDRIGADYPPAVTHPEFYYGFLTVTAAWQIAFLIIGSDPIRFRPLMIAAICEKGFYIAAMTWLYLMGRQTAAQFAITGFDVVFGALFVVSYLRTPRAARMLSAQC